MSIVDNLKDQLNSSLIFRIINIIVACFMIIGGVRVLMLGGFPQFIRGIYCIVFGVLIFLFEFRMPSVIAQHVSYMFSFLGRGIFYIFIGCIILNEPPLAIASGVIVAVFGVLYCILQFVPRVEPPSNMKREALDTALGDGSGGRAAHWATEQHSQQPQGGYYTGTTVNQATNSVV